jgi:hypothetical protein
MSNLGLKMDDIYILEPYLKLLITCEQTNKFEGYITLRWKACQ